MFFIKNNVDFCYNNFYILLSRSYTLQYVYTILLEYLKMIKISKISPWDEHKERKSDSNQNSSSTVFEFFMNNKKNNGNNGGQEPPFMRSVSYMEIAIFIVIILGAIMLSGFYTVNTDQEALVLRFGKHHRTVGPGLRYKLPSPIEKVELVTVTKIFKEQIGYNQDDSHEGSIQSIAGQMLTGDETIISIQFDVQWRISNAAKYAFHIRDRAADERTVTLVAMSAMRDRISQSDGIEYLNASRNIVANTVLKKTQETLDAYDSGIEVLNIVLQPVGAATSAVLDAYRDLQTSKEQREKSINEAQAKSNVIIPRARGEAEKILQEAEAYKISVIAEAEAQAQRFLKILKAYEDAKEVTMNKMYIDTMSSVLSNSNKVILDSKIHKSALPLVTINDLINNYK